MTPLEHQMWTEKYRPQTIKDCILPARLKKVFSDMVQKKEIPHMILAGTSGLGKTTVARALCNETDAEMKFINASRDGNIDTLRTTIQQYASVKSISGNRKVILLDEADYMTDAMQKALRGSIEQFSHVASFVFTANELHNIIDPIRSRCSIISFELLNESEEIKLKGGYLKRLKEILKTEEIEHEDNLVVDVMEYYFPDFRHTIEEIQTFSRDGKLSPTIIGQLQQIRIEELIDVLRTQQFDKIREWAALYGGKDVRVIVRELYDNLSKFLKPESVPDAILILNECQDKHTRVADKEINLAASLVTLAFNCEFN